MLIISLVAVMASGQQTPNVFTHRVGVVEVVLLSEGQGAGNSSIFVGATPEMIQRSMPEGSYPNSVNAFLVRLPGKTVLVDTGRRTQTLLDNLQSIGVSPAQIDVVLITHTHGDHIGGLLIDGQAAFPNAELYMSKPEHDSSLENAGARSVIEAYRSKLRLFEPKEIDANPDELFPGIRAVAAFGHTAGHTLFMVESGAERLLIWGDLTHAMAIQMPFPQVAMTFDSNPEMAIAERKKVLEYVAANNIAIAGIHNAFPGMGTLTANSDGGYTYTPVRQ